MTAMEIADRLRAEVELAALQHPRSSVAEVVTVSVGVTTIEGGLVARPADLVGQADRALYSAKGSGRNSCRASTDLAGN